MQTNTKVLKRLRRNMEAAERALDMAIKEAIAAEEHGRLPFLQGLLHGTRAAVKEATALARALGW